MTQAPEKETDALLRMLVYLKHELIRHDFHEEALHVDAALEALESKAAQTPGRGRLS